jgi:Ser/Thr protein kinase RdoA (MazF antagonist)
LKFVAWPSMFRATQMSKHKRKVEYQAEFITPQHLELLRGQFPAYGNLGPDGRVSVLEGGLDNVNLLLLDAAGVPRFVARHYVVSSPAKVAGELSLVSLLVGNRYPTPPPLATVTGAPFLDRGDQAAIALFPFIEGEIASSWSLKRKRYAGSALAIIHKICAREGFRIGAAKPRLEILRSWSAKVAALALRGTAGMSAEVSRFLAERMGPELSRFESLPFGPVHHDLNYGNVIWRGDGIEAVIDFDECHDAPLIMDLAAAFSYVAVDANYRLEPEACAALIEGYERERRLTSEERLMLPLAWDLLNLTSAVEFIVDNSDWLTSVEECRSYQNLYLDQKGRMEAIMAGLNA